MIDEKRLISDISYKFGLGDSLISNVISIIKKQPKIEDWIPFSKKLPQEEQKVIVPKGGKTLEDLFEFSFPEKDCEDEEVKGFLDGERLDSFCISKDNESIIAWQPLPESYKPKEDKK